MGLCLFRRQHLISSINLQELVHRHLRCCTMETLMQKTRLHVMEECLLLKLSFLVIGFTHSQATKALKERRGIALFYFRPLH